MAEYVTIRKEDADIIAEVIEETKPPSRLKEMITLFLFGFGGGVGVGVLIYFLR